MLPRRLLPRLLLLCKEPLLVLLVLLLALLFLNIHPPRLVCLPVALAELTHTEEQECHCQNATCNQGGKLCDREPK
jgi:hypothetical protein